MKKIAFLFYSLCIFARVITDAQAQQSQTDSISFYAPWITVTAHRYEKNVFETNMPVGTVRDAQVWQRGVDNIGDLLDFLPGLTYESSGTWSQKIVLRGLRESQLLTLIDGMRVDVFRSYGQHAPLLDVAQIERVEVIRGPASVLYGSDAIAGVVNFITKQPAKSIERHSIKAGARVQYSSVNQQFSQQLILSGNLNKLGYIFGINHRKAEDVQTPMGRLINTGLNGFTVDAKINFSISPSHILRVMGQSNRLRDVGIPIDPFAQQAKFSRYDRDLLALDYEYRAPNRIWTNVKANVYFQTGQRNFEALIVQKPKASFFIDQSLRANRLADNMGANLQANLTLFNRQMLTFGIDGFGERDNTHRSADIAIYNQQGLLVKDPPIDFTPPSPKSYRYGIGIFFENEYTPLDPITILAGARFDRMFSHADGTPRTLTEIDRDKADYDFSGNVGLLFRLSEYTRLYTNIGRAFRAPALQERFFKGVGQVGYLSGNPELRSETSLNIDAGIKWQYSRFLGEFSLFRNQIDNYIVMKPVTIAADTFIYDNVGKALLYGGELIMKIKIFPSFSLSISSAYVRGDDLNRSEPLPKMPPMENKMGLRYEPQRGHYWVELLAESVSKQQRVAQNETPTDGHHLVHFSAGFAVHRFLNIKSNLSFSMNIRNLLNEAYRDHLSTVTWWDAPGRNVAVGITSSF
ncbi:MAG: TonB-dependent receptor [candidate division KSB1 bacterium]|nr:TonB-dependent receptor [candidate division KSB1 bacterium]MDZ7336562.1 TonB-dependent receptor [candidate division KSB1 bacterium]MDZ7357764.1 TonB-dependent receptor [candidate division KSB1 bacterium]MDZ7400245.1 TonB-dependent receptor [candidate division KSB1 bacterium]